MELTDEQRAALTKARTGADMVLSGRRVRDRAIKEALDLGLSERGIAEGIGRKVDGKHIVSAGHVHKVRSIDPEDYS